MKDVFYYTLDGEKHEYHVKDDVPFSTLLRAIQDAVDMCYLEDGSFHPEVVEFAKEYVILDTLTDIDMPQSSDAAYRYVRAIDGIRSVDADFISDGIYSKIKYQQDLIVASMQSSGINRAMDAVEEVADKLSSLLDTVSESVDKMATQVDSGELADISAIAKTLQNIDMSPEFLAKTVNEMQKTKKVPKKTTKRTVAAKDPTEK